MNTVDPGAFIGQIFIIVLLIVLAIFVVVVIFRSIRIIPQAYAGIVERLGRYQRTLQPGLNLLVPFIDRLRPLVDMREQVVSFPPQPVITEDNLVVSIDTVVYFQVTDARAATYEIANYLSAVEQLTTTTLRNVVGGLNLEEALTSRDEINGQLRVVLDEATGKWGLRVSRVELKAIDPPLSIQDSMEKQMRAERDRRAAILTAEGTKQSAILEAEGMRQAEILRAEGDKQAAVLRAQGEAEAIETVFNAIHVGDPDDKLLAYQYLQTLPKIAESPSSKLWIIPSEFTEALNGIGQAFAGRATGGGGGAADSSTPRRSSFTAAHSTAEEAVAAAHEAASEADEIASEARADVSGRLAGERHAAPSASATPPLPEMDIPPVPPLPPVPPAPPTSDAGGDTDETNREADAGA
ncbi:SPFH domain-containing protein [Microbacterium sp.]|uniref:SPFH domain-containing protein n=1 Tax=Microbacterium sp. TaxID=51671 RepID=UPI002D78C6B8|nr:SPFH domain-containing protein [Microbacterium sp.]HET6303017.1 SPFH domain-containing protein [Microbacterium sp.]